MVRSAGFVLMGRRSPGLCSERLEEQRREEAMNGTPAAAVWCSLELGRPREERTVVGRESQKKKEGAGSRGGRSDGPIWVREGCCSAAAVVERNGCDGE